MVVTALTEKFGQDAQRLTERIKAVESHERSTALLRTVIQADFLDEIEKELEKIN